MDMDPRDALLGSAPSMKHVTELERLNLGSYCGGFSDSPTPRWRWSERAVRRMDPEFARRVYSMIKETVP